MFPRSLVWLTTLAAIASLVSIGCDDDDNGTTAGSRTVVAAKISALPNLGGTGHYELFLGNVSAGKFRVNNAGQLTDLAGNLLTVTLNGTNFPTGFELGNTTNAFVSIESEGDVNPAPSNAIVLSGSIFNDNGFLSLQDEIRRELGHAPEVTLQEAGAFYVMTSPSDNDDNPANEHQGVHFVSTGLVEGLTRLGIPPPNAPSMELGELPASMTYQAWVIDDSAGLLASSGGRDRSRARFLSIGRFSDPFGLTFDSDGFGPQAGEDTLDLSGLQGWVGSDFVTQGPIGQGELLTNGNFYVAISVEPVNDNDPNRPFTIILFHRIDAGSTAGSTIARSLESAFDIDNTLFVPPSAAIRLLP